jgi:hypothetical protein
MKGQVMIKKMKSIDRYFNNGLVGSMVLAMSKRVMNEVMCLAQDVVPNSIFYQDTDSMHIKESSLPVLEKAFKEKYGRELIGDELGQFHSDFCSRDKKENVECAHESFFIAKKIYCDLLLMKDGSENIMYRMKGVCKESTEATALQRCPGDGSEGDLERAFGPEDLRSEAKQDIVVALKQLYQDLYDGKEIPFDLCLGGKPLFEHNDDLSISSKGSFIRRIKIGTDLWS